MASPVYTSKETFKSHLNRSGVVEQGDDSMIDVLLSAAEYKTDQYCNVDGFLAADSATAQEFVGDGGLVLRLPRFIEITAIAVKTGVKESNYSAWALTDITAASGRPQRANLNKTPYTFIMINPSGSKSSFTNGMLGSISGPTVQVTAKWGWGDSSSRIMDLVRAAVLAQAMSWHARFRSKWHTAVSGPEFSTLIYAQELDPSIKDMLVNGGLVVDPIARGARSW